MTRGPVLIDLEGTAAAQPDAAPAVPDDLDVPRGAAMQHVAAIATRRPSRLARWFWSVTFALVGFVVSLAAWDYINTLLARSPILGGIATGLIALLLLVLAVIALRELAAFGRLRRLDRIQHQAQAALVAHDLKQARGVVTAMQSLYGNREDTAWGRADLASRQNDVLDADGLLWKLRCLPRSMPAPCARSKAPHDRSPP